MLCMLAFAFPNKKQHKKEKTQHYPSLAYSYSFLVAPILQQFTNSQPVSLNGVGKYFGLYTSYHLAYVADTFSFPLDSGQSLVVLPVLMIFLQI